MKYFTTILLFLVIALASAQAQGVRRLLLFAGDAANADLQLQRQMLQADSMGVVSRDIWIAVFADARTFRRMYDHYDVDRDEFTLILLKKDGSEQLRSEKPMPAKELFDLIDGVPAATQTGSDKLRNNQN
jgi:hypothetical protein